MKQPISEVYNIDCMDGMRNTPDKYYDLAVVDPPYGIGEDGRKSKSRSGFVKQKNGNKIYLKSNHKHKNWDSKKMGHDYWYRLFEVSKSQIIFGANYLQPELSQFINWGVKSPRRNEYNDFISANPTGFIIWDKCNGKSDFSDCEIILTGFNFQSFIKPLMWSGMIQAAGFENGTKQQGNKELNQKRLHPTEKPIILYDWLYKNYLPQGGKVLDTHLGSGSNRIAAHKAGNIDFAAYEIDKDYFDAQEKRYKEFISQLTMF